MWLVILSYYKGRLVQKGDFWYVRLKYSLILVQIYLVKVFMKVTLELPTVKQVNVMIFGN